MAIGLDDGSLNIWNIIENTKLATIEAGNVIIYHLFLHN